jgi:adenine-specific DNA glycosylase
MRQTEWRQVENVLAPLFRLYPVAQTMAEAYTEDIVPIIRSTGLYNRKASDLIAFSRDTVDGVPFDRRSGVGPYARDCHALLVLGETDRPGVADWALRRWQEWVSTDEDRMKDQAVRDTMRPAG